MLWVSSLSAIYMKFNQVPYLIFYMKFCWHRFPPNYHQYMYAKVSKNLLSILRWYSYEMASTCSQYIFVSTKFSNVAPSSNIPTTDIIISQSSSLQSNQLLIRLDTLWLSNLKIPQRSKLNIGQLNRERTCLYAYGEPSARLFAIIKGCSRNKNVEFAPSPSRSPLAVDAKAAANSGKGSKRKEYNAVTDPLCSSSSHRNP